ncbi:MAG: hypothetical protein K1X64_14825 [Myxococcaceae bacterium]|nr:hypothetical protein [Myxococcaceae bacterium]
MFELKKEALVLFLALLTACGDKVTGGEYPGEPLFSIGGTMTLVGHPPPTAPIHLAIAWYPSSRDASAPKAIVTQDVQYQGTFPLNYTFDFFGAPPPEAINDYEEAGQTYRVAWGILMAYDDQNGNGQLDPIAVGGSPVDHVLGTSVGDGFNGAPATLKSKLSYVEGAVPPSFANAVSGYNLWQEENASGGLSGFVPSSAWVPLPLDDTHELDFYVCEAVITRGYYSPFDLPCHIAATGGLRVFGMLHKGDGLAFADVQVSDGVNVISNAAVELNGVAIPFEAAKNRHAASGGTVVLNTPGDNVLTVTPMGSTTRRYVVKASGDFELLSPDWDQRFFENSSVAVSWNAAPNASAYSIFSMQLETPFALDTDLSVAPSGKAVESTTFKVGAAGPRSLSVSALTAEGSVSALGGSHVQVSVGRSRMFDVIPAGTQLGLTGALVKQTAMGQPGDFAYLSAFDGATMLTRAQVAVDGTALRFDTFNQQYVLNSGQSLTSGATHILTANLANRPEFVASVDVPSDFVVSPLPASIHRNGVVQLSWSAATGATQGYSVLVSDASGGVSFAATASQTALDVGGFGVVGKAYVTVAAEGSTSDRHLKVRREYMFEIDVTP